MTRSNPVDDQINALTDAVKKQRGVLDDHFRDVPPAQSKKLSLDEETYVYDHPDVLFPGQSLTLTQLRQMMLEKMGAKAYADFIRRVNGV